MSSIERVRCHGKVKEGTVRIFLDRCKGPENDIAFEGLIDGTCFKIPFEWRKITGYKTTITVYLYAKGRWEAVVANAALHGLTEIEYGELIK